MCGRIKLTPLHQHNKDYLGISSEEPDTLRTHDISGNGIAYGLVRSGLSSRSLFRQLAMRWGIETPAHPIRFARIETALMHQRFAEGMQHRRCVIMADGWWERSYFITVHMLSSAAMLAIWAENDAGSRRFALLTQPAPPSLQHIHPRVPLVGDPNLWVREGRFSTDYITEFMATKEAA